MSRPKTTIDWGKVNKLLKAQCDGVGIAGILGIHPNTFYRLVEEEFKISFSEYSAQKKGEGRELLKEKQFQVAMDGDKTMLVWLGKQYLGQSDKSEVKGDMKVSTPSIIVNSKETADKLKELENREDV